jgi:hypothetical protein
LGHSHARIDLCRSGPCRDFQAAVSKRKTPFRFSKDTKAKPNLLTEPTGELKHSFDAATRKLDLKLD